MTPDPFACYRLGLNHGGTFMDDRADRRWLSSVDSRSGTSVDLPHSWNEQDTFQPGIRYRQGHGSYKRSFRMPADDARLREVRWELISEGFYGRGDLWLNGRRVCAVEGQYLGFRIDVTDKLNPAADNIVAIRLDNNYHPRVLPGKKMPDFLLHGGLAGRIHLEARPQVCIDTDSLFARCADPLAAQPTLHVGAVLRNDGTDAHNARVTYTLIGPEGKVIQEQVTNPRRVASGVDQELSTVFLIDNPRLWHPDDPALYRVCVRLEADETPIDACEKRCGMRTAEFNKDGFYLNGRRVHLRGANRHESMPGFANALPRYVHRMDAALLKEAGFNLVRLAHCPQHPDFLDACDESGIMVYAEIASWKSVRPGPWGRAACRQMRAMVQRDRHHPSIILWGMGNESRSGVVYRALRRVVQQLDPTRPTIYAENHLHRGARWRTLQIPHVLGINYELSRLDDAAAMSRHGATLVSECSNCPRTFRGDDASEINQVETFARDLDRIDGDDNTAGYCLWSFNDYATQRKHRIIRCPGVVDAWRLPKPAARYMRARNRAEPYVFLDADWHAGEPGSMRRVLVMTNGNRVTIAVNGRTVAEQTGERHLQLDVAFEAGELTATAECDGGAVTDTLHSHAPAARLALDLEGSDPLGNRETTSVLCRVLDADGRPVGNWAGEAKVSISGPARTRLHNAASMVPLAAGVGRIFVTGTGEAGTAILRAEHDELAGAEATIACHPDDAGRTELPASGAREAGLANWPRRSASSAVGERLDIYCTLDAPEIAEAALQVWNGTADGLAVQREHDWGGRVLIGRMPGCDRLLVFKHFAIRRPRYIYKARRARHTLLHEEKIRSAGFATARGLCLIEKRVAGVPVASMVVSEAIENVDSVSDLINESSVSAAQREALLQAFAAEVGRWHRAGLFHGGMHINNILCRRANGEYAFVWIDNEEGRAFDAVPEGKRVHDLVHINRYRHNLTRAERLEMWRVYLRTTGVAAHQGSGLLRQVVDRSLAYRRRHGQIS